MDSLAETKTDPGVFICLDRAQIASCRATEAALSLLIQCCKAVVDSGEVPGEQGQLASWDGVSTETDLGNPPGPFHRTKPTFDKSMIR